ncbi:MAG: PKD domain-containing protein [Chitinophagaceae bacterium]|nr:PKD domain-containing protein [Chitinophagaceae bacterium]
MSALGLLYQRTIRWKKQVLIPGAVLVFFSIAASAQNKAAFTMSKSEGCAPLSVNFSDQSAGNVASRVWNLGSGDISNHDNNVGSIFAAPGTYNITLTVTFSNGQVESLTQQVRVYEKPSADFVPAVQQECGSSRVLFTASSPPGNNTTYEWDFGDGNHSAETSPMHQYSREGNYQVKLTAANGTCKTDFTAQVVVPKAGIPLSAQIVTAPQNACAQKTLSFLGSITGAAPGEYTVQWNFGDNTTATGLNATHRYTAAGTYTVKLIATSNTGTCSDTALQQVTVQPKVAAAFSASSLFSCTVPFNVRFTNQSTGGANMQYKWNFGGNNESSAVNPEYNFTTPGNKTIKLVVTDGSGEGGCSDSTVKTQYIRIGNPSPDFYYTPAEGCFPLNVRFALNTGNTNAADPVTSYTWDWGDGSHFTTSSSSAIRHTYNDVGTYDITLTVTTRSGCTSTSPVHKVTVTATCTDDGVVSEGGAFTTSRNCSDKYRISFDGTAARYTFVSWDFGDGSPVNTDNPATHTFPDTKKEWLVTLTRRNNNTNQTETITKKILIVDEKPAFTVNKTNTCTNMAIRFTTQGIDPTNIKRYIWDWGDGSPQKIITNNLRTGRYTTGNTSYRYNRSGKFSPKLIIEDKLGCMDSIELDQPVTISGPTVDFTATPASSCSSPLPVSFTSTSTSSSGVPIVSWQWTFDGNNTFTTTEDSTVQYLYAPDEDYKAYTVKLKIKDADGCENEISKPDLIQVTNSKASFTSSDTLVCGKNDIGFNNTSVAQTASFTWHWGDGSTTETTSKDPISHTYASDGIYTVKLVVKPTAGGCADSMVRTDYIKIVKPKADFTIGDTLQCVPVAVGFENTSTYAIEYTWNFDNGNTYTQKDPPPQTYTSPGTYTATVIAKGINGCADTTGKTFRIKGPIATISVNGSGGCAPYLFDAKVSGNDISTCSWDFGDGTAIETSGPDSVVSHTYTLPGSYTPTVILTNEEGCTNTITASQPVRVGLAEASFSVDNTRFCDAGTAVFTNTSPADNHFTQQLWDFGDGKSFNGANPPPHLYDKPGTYPVSLIVETDFGCRDTVNADSPVTVSAKPKLSVTGSDAACEGDIIRMEGAIQSSSPVFSISWFSNGATIGNSTLLELPATATGSVPFLFTAVTEQGCADTIQKNITVHSLPVPDATPDTTVCAGSPVMLHASGGGTYVWESEEAIENPNASGITIMPQTSAGYFVTVTSPFGCVQKDTVNIIAEALVNLVARTDYSICKGDLIRLNASGNTNSFSWYPVGDMDQPNTSSPTVSPDTSTSYLVIGHSENSCPDDSAAVYVAVSDTPTVQLENDITILGGAPFTLQVQASNNVVNYEWSPPDGLSCYTCPNPVALPEKDQQYVVTVATSDGCKASDTIAIALLCNKLAIYIPNAFTPNGDGLNDRFYIKGFGLKTVNYLRIFDRWGREIFSRRNFEANDPRMGWDGTLPGSNLPSGPSTYAYVTEVVCSEGIPTVLRGQVTLIR